MNYERYESESYTTMPIVYEGGEGFVLISDLYMPVTVYPHFDMEGGFFTNHSISRPSWSMVTKALRREEELGDEIE